MLETCAVLAINKYSSSEKSKKKNRDEQEKTEIIHLHIMQLFFINLWEILIPLWIEPIALRIYLCTLVLLDQYR